MAIKTSLLNKTVIINRPTTTLTNSGDNLNTVTEIATDVPCRINRHDTVGANAIHEQGQVNAATHRGFFNNGTDIQGGDKVVDGSKTYTVVDVNDEPGGKLAHHMEVELLIEDTD